MNRHSSLRADEVLKAEPTATISHYVSVDRVLRGTILEYEGPPSLRGYAFIGTAQINTLTNTVFPCVWYRRSCSNSNCFTNGFQCPQSDAFRFCAQLHGAANGRTVEKLKEPK